MIFAEIKEKGFKNLNGGRCGGAGHVGLGFVVLSVTLALYRSLGCKRGDAKGAWGRPTRAARSGGKTDYDYHCSVVVVISFPPKRLFLPCHF